MTYDEAKEIISKHYAGQQCACNDGTIDSECFEAKGFIEGYESLKEQNREFIKALKEIVDQEVHWIGDRKREGCIDFERCSCDKKRAKEALAKYSKGGE